jgi:hypothetical protein
MKKSKGAYPTRCAEKPRSITVSEPASCVIFAEFVETLTVMSQPQRCPLAI